MFIGYVQLEATMNAPVLILDMARKPVNLDGPPAVRVYGPLGLVAAVTGLGEPLDEGVVTDATNATPIVLTSAGHGLSSGTVVTVSALNGPTAANGTWTVTRLGPDTFSLNGSSANGPYAGGGVWNVTGLYTYAIACTAANGFEVSTTYYVLITGSVGGVAVAEQQTFIVV